MYYDEKLLFKLIKDVKKGDVVKISYCFNDNLSDHYNTILIIEDKGGLKAVWYDDEDYQGRGYVITNYQVITEIVERNINIEEYFKNVKIKRLGEAKNDSIFMRKED